MKRRITTALLALLLGILLTSTSAWKQTYPELDYVFEIPGLKGNSSQHRLQKRQIQKKTVSLNRIAIVTVGTRGDVQPYIALCKEFQSRSPVKCRIITHKTHEDFVTKHGLEFFPIAGDPAKLMAIIVAHGMYSAKMMMKSKPLHAEIINSLLDVGPKALEDCQVLIEAAASMVGRFLVEKKGIAYLRVFPFPWTKNPDFQHPFVQNLGFFDFLIRWFSWDLIEQLNWFGIQPAVNNFRVRNRLPELGLFAPKYPDDSPFLYAFSSKIVQNTWPGKHTHVTGYWFLEDDGPWTPSPALQRVLDNVRPGSFTRTIVYIGFGSMVVKNPDRLLKNIISAVSKAGLRAVIATGWSAQGESDPNEIVKEEYRDTIHILRSVPHSKLFPLMDAVVHHGGAGTFAAAIRAGRPMLVVPFALDQYFWAKRAVSLELGDEFSRKDLDKSSGVSEFVKKLKSIATNEKYRANAMKYQEIIRSENGLQKAVDTIIMELMNNPKGVVISPEENTDQTQLVIKDKDDKEVIVDGEVAAKYLQSVLSKPNFLQRFSDKLSSWIKFLYSSFFG